MSRHSTKILNKGKILMEARYPDSMYDLRLFLLKDGRKRGLWVNLEEDSERRNEQDHASFKRGFDEFVKYLTGKKLNFNKLKPGDLFELVMMMKNIHFRTFFDRRTEGVGLRLSWKQVKKLAAALNKGHRNEKAKTEKEW